MATSTGTVGWPSAQGLFDALVTFMTGNGWTVHDTISSTDKVLTSTGTDTHLDMFYRLTINTSANYPYKALNESHRAISYFIIRGYHYWNAGTHVGTNEFGKFGPWQLQNSANTLTQHMRTDSTTIPIAAANVLTTIQATTPDCRPLMMFDGRRKLWGANHTTVKAQFNDFIHGENFQSSLTAGSLSPGQSCGCWYYDATTDKDFFFYFSTSPTMLLSFIRYDPDLDTWAAMPPPIWNAVAADGGAMVWDGGDYIYAMKGAATTDFARFSISGGSWTTLAVTPVARGTAWDQSNAGSATNTVYIPASVTGFDSDVIYTFLTVNGATNYYRYNVSGSLANTWTTIAQPITTNSASLWWDHQQYMYFYYSSTGVSLYRMGLGVASGTITAIAGASLVDATDTFTISDGVTSKIFEFDSNASITGGHVAVTFTGAMTATQVRDAIITAINGSGQGLLATVLSSTQLTVTNTLNNGATGAVTITETVANAGFLVSGMALASAFQAIGVLDTVGRTVQAMLSINHATAKVRCSTVLDTQYWFHGDADSMRVVTKINGHYYWTYFGRYDPLHSSTIRTLSAPSSAGGLVNIDIDDSTGYAAGDTLTIFDPTTGNAEQITVQSVPSGTRIVASHTLAYTTGSRVGVDVSPQILTGDCGTACLPLSYRGYRKDTEADHYIVTPQLTVNEMQRDDPDIRGSVEVVPMLISNPYSTLSKYESLGTLRSTYSVAAKTYPGVQNGDIVVVNSINYMAFQPYESKRYASDNRLILIPV